MKRILISLAAAFLLLPAVAQTNNPGAKVDPKNNKVGRPVVDKPKVALMTRDELRACFNVQDNNRAEGEAIKVAQAAQVGERSVLLKQKDELTQSSEALSVRTTALVTERAEILKQYEDIKVQAPKLEKAALEALNKGYTERAAAFEAQADALNKDKLAYKALTPAFDAKIEAHNQGGKALDVRAEAYLDKLDEWKVDCGNKPYDEADEAALKKERAAAGK